MGYPAHAIRHHLACFHASQGRLDQAESALGQLRRLTPRPDQELLMVMILAASHMAVAGVLPGGDKRRPRLLKHAHDLLAKTCNAMDQTVAALPIGAWVTESRDAVGDALEGEDRWEAIREQARVVAY